MRTLALLLLLGGLFTAGCSKADLDCAKEDDPARTGDRLLAGLRFDAVAPVRYCGRMPAPSLDLLNAAVAVGGGASDGTGIITPGSTVPFVAVWTGGPAQAVNLNFGGSTFLRIPVGSEEAQRGAMPLPANLDPDFCAGLDAICHALKCCMQIVTPSGAYSAPVARQMVLDCTGGKGCAPPYNAPPGSCGPQSDSPSDPWPMPSDDLGVPEPDLAGCSPSCHGATPFCTADHRCVECRTDNDCPGGAVCHDDAFFAGRCLPGCNDDGDCQRGQGGDTLRCCDSECVDITSNARHCGACGSVCTVPNAASTCTGGRCEFDDCLAGWGNCDRDPANGCEVNLRTDLTNCAACGAVCMLPNARSGCANGCFIAACLPGYQDCDGDGPNGCEARLDSDPMNCGACGNWCAFMNGAAQCIQAKCVFAGCIANYLDCDGNANNGCEVSALSDPKNCGGCGIACPLGHACSNGACR